jgi:hypothetical protein
MVWFGFIALGVVELHLQLHHLLHQAEHHTS